MTAPKLDDFLGQKPAKRRRLMKWVWIGLPVLLVLLLLARCFSPPKPTTYATAAVTRGDLTVTVSATGNLTPTNQVNVGSQVSGLIRDVYVRNNDKVTKGQPLAQLDLSLLKAALAQSEASLQVGKAAIAQAKATVEQTKAALARDEQVFKLSDGKVPSQVEMDAARADYARAVANVASAEAQVAAIADDIAYNNHDVDDGLQAELFAVEDLDSTPLIGPALASVRADYPGIDVRMLRLEAVRRMIGVMVEDVIAETQARAAAGGVDSPEAVRMLGRPLVGFSRDRAEDLGRLRLFLHERMYRHYRVNRTRSQARRLLREMFELFMREPDVLPGEWAMQAAEHEGVGRARLVCDYIAGMTDRFAIEEHRRLFTLDVWH